MRDLDLDGIRAQLRASASERRSPARTLSSLIRGKPPAPLLGPVRRPQLPVPPTPAPPAPGGDALLELGGALAPELKRSAFGRRRPPAEPAPEPQSSSQGDMGGTLVPSPSARQDDSAEPPFLPEDLEDPGEEDAERIYAGAGATFAAPPPSPPSPGPGELALLHLEKRLLEEHAGLIRALAGR